MKKCSLLLSLLFVFLFSIFASAAETEDPPYADAGELYQSWNERYPDYISGVWSTDGSMNNLTFGIAESADFEAAENEILSLIKNDDSVTIVRQKYTRNDLLRIQEELYKYFEDAQNNGLCATGLYETENCVQVEFLESAKENETTKALIVYLQEAYGDAVRIAWSEGYVTLTLEEKPAAFTEFTDLTTRTRWYDAFFTVIACLCVLSVCGFVFIRKKQTAALQTVTGTVETGSRHYTKKEVEAAVTNTAETPDTALDKRIMDMIE